MKAGYEPNWIDRRERLPSKRDEDGFGCILVFNMHSGVRISNAANFMQYGGLCETHWARMPEGPKIPQEYLEEVRAR